MKTISRAGKIFFMFLIFIMAIFIGNEKVFAANVSSFDELKTAIETGTDDINVQGTIVVTETLTIRRDVKISGGGLKASNLATTEPESGNIFYVEEGKNFELENITLDGDNKARIIYSNGGILKITNSTIKNGFPGANAKANPGGGVFLRGGSLTATDTDFIGNTPGTNTALPQGDGDLNGGAIYSGSTKADIKITGGNFEDNEVKAYGHGAAIYQENGILNVTGTSFKNNKGHVEGGNAGTQGACIHTRDKVTATISGVTAEIAKGFNTGGFLRSWKSDVTVTDSKFTIKDLGDGYGYSGGALCFEGGTSKVEKSEFTCKGSKLFHAGGFIDIVGTGTHVIDGNKITGAGKENGQQIASFGGAISIEEGANATVKINKNTITNTSASDTGGAIAIGTHKGVSTPSKVTMSGNTISNTGTLFWGAQHGGGVFIGPDAKVTMSNDTITNTRSSYGGGVYNEGKLTISGGSSLTGGVGSKLGGEIYNNGDLTVDDATITGNFVGGAAWQQYASHGKNFELGGTNIYAEKDVTITPNANITTGKDVRVLDGQSKILLTGALTKEIDVSVSEVAGGNETQKRRVGYVVGAGKDGYAASYDDANFLHYIGRTNAEDPNHYSNQPRADFGDHESTGKWDFVLNPKTKEVVLGQRVKLTLYANGKTETPAKFDGVTVGRNEEEGILTKLDTEDTKEDTYDIYTDGGKSAILAPEPIRKGYAFTGWYKEAKVNDDAADENKSGKTKVDNQKLVEGTGEITSIIDPHEHELYAGWEKVVKVKKIWEDNNDEFSNRPDNIKVKLYSGSTLVASEIELNAENNWEGEFRNIRRPKIVREYTVKEFPGQVTGYKTGEVTGNDIDGFTVTNETEYITIEGSKTWEHGENKGTLPTTVTVNLYENDKATDKSQTGASWKFENLPKYKNKEEVKYTLTENPVENYTSISDGYNFTNTYTNKFKVTYKFVPEDTSKTLPQGVMTQLPAEEKDKDNNTKVTPSKSTFTDVTTEDGTWSFVSWDKTEATINGKDVEFVGTWKFTEKTSDFTITKAVDKTTYEKAGDVLTYTVVVTNTGEKDLTGLTISDDKTTFENPTFDLSLKEKTKTFTYTYKVTEDDVTAKSVKNIASVTDGKTTKTSSATSNLVEKTSGFDLTKTVDKTAYEKAGDVLTYKVTVKNTGEKKLENLVLTDSLVTITDNTFTLDVKESKEFTYTYTVTEADVTAKKVTNTATATLDKDSKTASTTSTLKEDKPKPPVTNIITEYVDIYGNELIPSKDGDQPVEIIPGYEFIETRRTEKVVSHIYKKIEREEPNPWFLLFPRVERKEKVETISVNAVVPEKTLLNKEDHKAYMFGYPDWTFLPNNNMTRAEVTAMFARLLKNYPSTNFKYNLPYSDVFEGDWYYPAVGFMTENNIIKGYEDGTFRPNAPITRAEFATIASKFDEILGGDVKGFYDVPASHWALKYINSAYERGWVTGYEDGSFRPDRNITRAEVVTVTNKMLIRYADVDYVRAHRDLLINFKDLDESHWAYFNIMEATHGHDFMRKANGKDETWERLNGEAFIFPDLRYEDR